MSSRFSTVLIVDDNSLLLSVLSEVFTECGFKAHTAKNGFTALTEIARCTPDLLISDLNMPGMSGYELLSVVRRRFPKIVVLAMSGSYSGLEVPAGVAADAFYAKGASSIAQLLDVIQGLLAVDSLLLNRNATPIWVPELLHDREHCLLVTCPSCLRPSSHPSLQSGPLFSRRSCPHCLQGIDLLVVKTSYETDRTSISATTHHVTAPGAATSL